MKSGYEQFFKQVRAQAPQPQSPQPQRSAAPRSAPRSSSQSGSQSASQSARQPNARAALRAKQAKAQVAAQTARRKSRAVPWHWVGLLGLGLGFSLWGLLAPKSIERFANTIDIQMFGSAGAAEAEKSASTESSTEAKSTQTKTGKDGKGGPAKVEWTQEEMSFFSKLNERKKELDLREAELNKLDEELQQQKAALEKRFQQLDQMRTQIADTLKSQVDVDKDKVDKLVEFYSNMKPQQAAKIMETLNEDLAVETLGRMKKKNAAEIMNLLEAKKAQSISEKFAGYKHK